MRHTEYDKCMMGAPHCLRGGAHSEGLPATLLLQNQLMQANDHSSVELVTGYADKVGAVGAPPNKCGQEMSCSGKT